ncbi:MAG: hypothetical protein ABIF71_04440 [Planctomycetota bacterium]|jgi:hypothetical protein
MTRLSHDAGILNKLVKELEMAWEATGPYWRDHARAEFDKAFIHDLVPDVMRAADAVGRINRLLRKVVQECS